MKSRKFLGCLLLPALVAVVLGGCYMPIRFDAEIEIHRTGHYDFKFDGYLAKVELYKGLRNQEIGYDEEKKQIEIIRNDFERDPNVREFKYIKLGHFKVNWAASGDLIKTRTVSFFNRSSEYMLGLAYNKESRRITMSGKSLKRDLKDQLREMGLDWSGEIRVFTDAKVVSHNATSVRKNKRLGGRFMTYTWEIKNIYAPTPSLVIQIL